MEAGKLDRRITIQRATISQNDLGEEVEVWADLATVWAAAKPVSDGERRERMVSGEVSASAETRFTIRWSSTVEGVNPKDRISYDGIVWDIWSAKEIGRRVGIEITAAARSDQ